MTVSREMPTYTTAQRVWALKIKAIKENGDGSATIVPEEPEYAPFPVGIPYMRRENPKVGGYYVVYPGGHAVYRDPETFNLHFKPNA